MKSGCMFFMFFGLVVTVQAHIFELWGPQYALTVGSEKEAIKIKSSELICDDRISFSLKTTATHFESIGVEVLDYTIQNPEFCSDLLKSCDSEGFVTFYTSTVAPVETKMIDDKTISSFQALNLILPGDYVIPAYRIFKVEKTTE